MTRNVILITIDTLRADHLSCYGYHRKTSPNIDNLAKNGILFKYAFSNGPWTPFSFPSILTSTYPLQFSFDFHLSPERIMISEVLKKNGYFTAAFHSNPYLSSFYGYNRGFDVFSDFLLTEKRVKYSYGHPFLVKLQKKVKERLESILGEANPFYHLIVSFHEKVLESRIRTKRSQKLMEFDEKYIEDASSLNKKVIYWLRNVKEPFFLWVHYMDVRMGYMPPDMCLEYLVQFTSSLPDETKIRKLNEKIYRNIYVSKDDFSDEEVRLLIDLYDAETRYVDEHIRLLLDEVKDLGLLRDTLVVITADHGDEFLEHGDIHHNPKLYDELLHVPLIFYAPKLGKGITIGDLVSLIDLAPTIVDILGIKRPEQWVGESLLPLLKGEKKANNAVISEVLVNGKRKIAYRTKKWKFIFNIDNYELYNLEKDIGESTNVAEENLDIVRDFSSKIEEHISMENKMRRNVEERKRTKEKIRKLKAGGKI